MTLLTVIYFRQCLPMTLIVNLDHGRVLQKLHALVPVC